MYTELIEKLKMRGVIFANGLTAEEVKNIESVYNVKFSEELRKFYMCELPVSEGFYDWRDLSKNNIEKIKSVLATPALDFKRDINDIEWSDSWGEEPDEMEERNMIIMKRIEDASILIPLYKHRYISTQFDKGNPVFSIYDTDIIYYGENLIEYFHVEFKFKNHSAIDYAKIKGVNFWSDII